MELKDLSTRYERNGIFTEQEQKSLRGKSVCVIGCGGLGGTVCQQLVRAGIGELIICDGDKFQPSNLNRQSFATEENMGQYKALCAKTQLEEIDSRAHIFGVAEMLGADNYIEVLEGSDVVVDCVDSPKVKIMLEEYCRQLNIPLVHGAIDGWFGQVTTIIPNELSEPVLDKVYKVKGLDIAFGTPPFIAGIVANYQVCEVLKFLSGEGELLNGKMLFIDCQSNQFEVMSL